jgi:hypothetical protein
MDQEAHGQLKAEAWRTLKAVDHVDAKAADEGLTISPEWRSWRGEVRAVIRGDRMDIPPEPPRYVRLGASVIAQPERARDDLLDFDAEPVEELTGDQLLSAFEKDEEAAALLVQTLSALRQKHISEQLNVERARLDREHQATGVANPRSAQIDRLLGLLTRRGEV